MEPAYPNPNPNTEPILEPAPTYDKQEYDEIFSGSVMALPVAQQREEIAAHSIAHPNSVLRADTGSGKSIAFPLIEMEVRDIMGEVGKIGLIEPRRDSTIKNARSIANIYGTPAITKGKENEIGYQVRGDSREGKQVNVITDGYLPILIRRDPLLSRYWELIFDENHEHNWNQDFGMAVVKEIVNPKRIAQGMPPVRIKSASATINVEETTDYLTNKQDPKSFYNIEIPPRHKIFEEYLEEPLGPKGDYKLAAAKKVMDVLDLDDGDIYVFLPGTGEINAVAKHLQELLGDRVAEFDILPFHAQLTQEEREKVTDDRGDGKKRLVLSTNAGETGFTPNKATRIIDTGLIRQKVIDPATAAEIMVTVPHTQSGLDQRRGRVGRERNGYYYGLFTKADYDSRPKYPEYETDRMDLKNAVIAMKGMGVPDIYTFNLPKKPERKKLEAAVIELQNLGILDKRGELTEDGDFVFALDIGAEKGIMVLEGLRNDCLDEMVSIAALLTSGRSPFIDAREVKDAFQLHTIQSRFNLLPDTTTNPFSDPSRYLNAWVQYVANGKNAEWAKEHFLDVQALRKADEERTEIIGKLGEMKVPFVAREPTEAVNAFVSRAESVRKATAWGLVNKIKYLDSKEGKYKDLLKPSGFISMDPISSVPHKIRTLIASVGVRKSGDHDPIANICVAVEPEWLTEFLPDHCTKYYEKTFKDSQTGEMKKTYQLKFTNPDVFLGTVTEILRTPQNAVRRRPVNGTLTNRNASRNPAPSPARNLAPPNPTLKRRGNPLVEKMKQNREAGQIARNLAENQAFPPTPQNRTIMQKAYNLWLKMKGKL